MPILSRRVPIAITPPPRGGALDATVGGQPAAAHPGIYLDLEVQVEGRPDPRSGYLVSIALIDAAVREALPRLLESVAATPRSSEALAVPVLSGPALPGLLRALGQELARGLGRSLHSLHLATSPYFTIAYESAMPHHALFTRRFDFCAAHRLFLPELSDAENLALFGKCSHPAGHGHNYRLDVTVSVPLDGPAHDPEPWSETVRREIVDRYDHRNLNVDCPEFASLNPSVEHIAQVCHDRLLEPLRRNGVELRRVRVWESEKTWCEVP